MPEPMTIDISRVPPEEIRDLRDRHRREMDCQIVHDSLPERGLADCHAIRLDGRSVGYGCLTGEPAGPRETIIEFHVLLEHRMAAREMFRRLVAASRARYVTAQTNDGLLTLALFDVARDLVAESVLFHDALTTRLAVGGATFRRLEEEERPGVFDHGREPVGDWAIELGGSVVATGGVLFHYNPPYGDLFMEVAAPFRGRGIGSFLVQELKRVCREMGKIPVARCRPSNEASRATLQKAGLLPCAHLVRGVLAPDLEEEE